MSWRHAGIRPSGIPAPRNRSGGRLALTAVLAVLLAAGRPASAQDAYPFATPHELSGDYETGDRFMGIRLLGTLSLGADRLRGLPFVEISGLAWDDDDGLLYALSDQGRVFHVRPVLRDGRLVDAVLVDAHPLREADGRPVRRSRADAEGITVVDGANGISGDARLLVTYEVSPRVVVHRPDGGFLESIPLPAPIRTTRDYVTRNKGIEAITVHPRRGILVGTEWPLTTGDSTVVPLYPLPGGDVVRFRRHPARKSALVALEALPDGSILTLERSFDGLLWPVVISLRRFHPGAGGDPDAVHEPRPVAELDSSRGFGVDNFEGLARHRDMRFFMVSDDNQNFFQRTLLVYFEILGDAGSREP